MATFEKSPRDAVIVAAVRSAVGKGKRGTLAQTRPDELMAQVIDAALARVPAVTPEMVEDVIIGCATPEAEQGLNIGRNAVMMSSLPDTVPAETVNRFCSSGLQTIAHAAERIRAGWADVVVAGGVESMSLLPMGGHHILPHPEFVRERPEAYIGMGLTAEIVADRYGVTRADQDAFSLRSHEKALAAQAAGRFDAEIVPVQATVYGADGPSKVEFKTDEGPRAGSTIESLAKLNSPFKTGGSVTAASSSQVSDGAAVSVLMSREKAEALGLPILAVLRMYSVVGVPPDVMGIGPAKAIPKALEKAGLTIDDIDIFEVNEAFASQAIYCQRELGIPDDKLNPNGGAIALGHPLGCTGARMTATLLSEMEQAGAHLGVVSMCIGGGMGAAAVFEREA